MRKPRFKRNVFDSERLKVWAKDVKRKDSFKCFACGYKGRLHSHHILPKSKFPKFVYEIWNGITLCISCHTGDHGVHGSKSPRNDIVKKLRDLLKQGDCSSVKNFNINFKPKVKYNLYKNFSKSFNRNLFVNKSKRKK
jgi:5-methylcytosine-specific restriction endonuclease McrA